MPQATVAAIITDDGSEFADDPQPSSLRVLWHRLRSLLGWPGASAAASSDDRGLAAVPVLPAGPPPHVLLTRRDTEPFRGYWCLPGGHIDEYELAVAAVIREVSEETNLSFRPRFFGYFDEIIEERGIHAVVLAFDGPALGAPRPGLGEVSEMCWFSLDVARRMSLAFKHAEILGAYAASLG